MKKIGFLCHAALAVFATSAERLEARPPNVVIVLVDDLGWMDLSCQGSTYYETPNIDRLAAEGVRFTNGYAACAVCSPTRASVMTGRYPHRTGVTDWIRARFQGGNIPDDKKNPCWKPPEEWSGKKVLCPPNALWMEHEEITLAELLKTKGYTSCYIGKWHLGPDEWYPTTQGFDFNYGGCDYGQPPSYFDPFNRTDSKDSMLTEGIPGLPGRNPGEFLTDREADEACNFMRTHASQPFYLQLSHYAVHTPIMAKSQVEEKYKTKKDLLQKNAKYAALVESVDDSVGRVLATLRELQLEQNTLVIFTSDNGGLLGPTNNTPLRSGKGYAYEGGIRVPLIMRWSGQKQAGITVDVPAMSIDLLPTVAAITGTPLPKNLTIDGQDLRPVLSGQGTLDRDTLYWHFPHYRHAPGPYSIIREGDWKLIVWYEGPRSLFNLKEDLGEKNDLAEAMPEKVKALEAKLMAHLHATTDRIPIPNPKFTGK